MDKEIIEKIGLEFCDHNDAPCSFCLMRAREILAVIKKEGYRKINGEPPILTREDIKINAGYTLGNKVWDVVLDLLIDQRDADISFYTKNTSQLPPDK